MLNKTLDGVYKCIFDLQLNLDKDETKDNRVSICSKMK